MKRTALALLVLAATAAPATAGGGCHREGPPDQRSTTTIDVEHSCFAPVGALVAPGATVTFVNGGSMEHNLGGPNIAFAELPKGASHTVTFDAPGLYPYACTIHPGMAGVVVVGGLPAGTDAGTASTADAAGAAAAPPAATGGGGSALPWVAGATGLVFAALLAVGFGRRTRGVPVPAR